MSIKGNYNIFFSLPIQGKRLGNKTYSVIVKSLEKNNYNVINKKEILSPPRQDEIPKFDPQKIFNSDLNQLNNSELLLAEISKPSLGVGYEIAYAQTRNLPIICICKEKYRLSTSLFIKGINYNYIEYIYYEDILRMIHSINSITASWNIRT